MRFIIIPILNIFFLFVTSFTYSQNVKIDKSIGVIVFSDIAQYGDTIIYYSENDKKMGQFICNEESYISLNCILKKDSFLYFIDDNSSNIYYLLSSNKVLLETWQDYILRSFSIAPKEKNNFIYCKPNVNSNYFEYDNNNFYHPISIQKEWLELEWENDKKQKKRGWIRWNNNGTLLIDIFLFA